MNATRCAVLACATALAGCAAVGETPVPTPANSTATGQQLYARHCLSCHQADGGGVPNMQPPIVGGTWVKGDPRSLALFVMTGGFGSEQRKDSDLGNVMPPFAQLPDDELAAVLTYIRATFGDGATAVTAAQVAEARSSM